MSGDVCIKLNVTLCLFAEYFDILYYYIYIGNNS